MFRLFCFFLFITFFSCSKDNIIPPISRERTTRNIQNDGISVTVIIDQPNLKNVDVLMVFQGTVSSDRDILTAANTTLNKFKGILDRKDMMLISIAYPQENVLLGDSILQLASIYTDYKGNEII